MTKLTGRLRRVIKVHPVGLVHLTLHEDGLEMNMPGQRKKLRASWEGVLHALRVPHDAPSYLEGRPVDFLKYQQAKNKKGQDAKIAKSEGAQ